MTLLAALWTHDGRPTATACGRMLAGQADMGWHSAVAAHGNVALGSAIRMRPQQDLSDARPITGADGSLRLVADVRLDNREDLIRQLGLVVAEPISDRRLMMLCFEKWGDDAVSVFVGDFALALFDERRERLLLARDFAGQRPLLFCETKSAVAVASMARGIHALDLVSQHVNEARLLEVLAGLPHEGRSTFFQGIERVEPGELLEFQRNRHSSRIYWRPPDERIQLSSHAEYAEALREKLDQAVAARLRGVSGAVGTHLSAGLDSSAVTTSAAIRWPGQLLAFTSVPAGKIPALPAGRFGHEGALAAETAAMYPNIRHHQISSGKKLPVENLSSELQLYERPDLNLPNLVWSNQIHDAAAARGVQVLLTGQAGNATISYGGVEVLRDLLREGSFRTFLAETFAARKADSSVRDLLSGPLREFLPSRVFSVLSRFRNRDQHPALAGGMNPLAAGAAAIIARYERYAAGTDLSSVDARVHMLRRVDLASFNKGVLLRWDIDLRDPTADRRLVEFCLQVPVREYFRDGTPRALVKTALEGRIPESVRCNRLRGLQAANWFSVLSRSRDEMTKVLLRIRELELARNLLNVGAMSRTLETWTSASHTLGSLSSRYGLLRGLSAGEFIRIYSTGEGPPDQ